jgi:hypothetical protein
VLTGRRCIKILLCHKFQHSSTSHHPTFSVARSGPVSLVFISHHTKMSAPHKGSSANFLTPRSSLSHIKTDTVHLSDHQVEWPEGTPVEVVLKSVASCCTITTGQLHDMGLGVPGLVEWQGTSECEHADPARVGRARLFLAGPGCGDAIVFCILDTTKRMTVMTGREPYWTRSAKGNGIAILAPARESIGQYSQLRSAASSSK